MSSSAEDTTLQKTHNIPTAAEKGDVSWGDVMLPDRGKPLSARHKLLAQLAAGGSKNCDIAKQLDLTESRVSILLSNSRIQSEIERYQDKYYEKTIEQRFQEVMPAAMDVLEEIIAGRSDEIKPQLRLEAAKWILEKTTGKAVQKHEVRGNLFSELLTRLDTIDVRTVGGGGPVKPVNVISEVEAPPQRDQFDLFLDSAIPNSPSPKDEE